jgi:hypothetical protein
MRAGGRADGRTDLARLVVAFSNFADVLRTSYNLHVASDKFTLWALLRSMQ